mgnify:CR=1 FL=1
MSGWFDEGEETAGEPGGAAGDDRAERHGPAFDDGRESESAGTRERYRVKGDDLLRKVKELIREGNVRKITIRNEADEVLLSFPLAAGVIGAALLPMWAAIGAVAALVGNCSIEVERRE